MARALLGRLLVGLLEIDGWGSALPKEYQKQSKVKYASLIQAGTKIHSCAADQRNVLFREIGV